MTYLQICEYVFKGEDIAWKDRKSKCRKKEFVYTRQLCMALGKRLFALAEEDLAFPFGKDRSTAFHSIKTINNEIDCYQNKYENFYKYHDYLRERIKKDNKEFINKYMVSEIKVELFTEAMSQFKKALDAYCSLFEKQIINKPKYHGTLVEERLIEIQ